MTMPGGQPPAFFDPANPLLAPGPARLDTGTITGAGGQLGVITVRNSGGEATVMLAAADVRKWAAILTQLADSMSTSGLIVPGGPLRMPPPPGNGQQR